MGSFVNLSDLEDEIDEIAKKFIKVMDIEFNDKETRKQVIRHIDNKVRETIKGTLASVAFNIEKMRLTDNDDEIIVEDNNE
jgi:GH24 family phage-related lysozyme (muramidase)